MTRRGNTLMRFEMLPWVAGDAGGGAEIQKKLRGEAEGEDRLPEIKNGGGVGCSVYFERIAGVERRSQWSALRRGESAIVRGGVSGFRRWKK